MPTVAAYYRFTPITEPTGLVAELRATFAQTDLLGTTLIAPEGINGTMAASPETLTHLLNLLHHHTGLTRNEVKFSTTEAAPFRRQKFKLKREIITFRNRANANRPLAVDPTRPGTYVDPADWNTLLADPNTLILDTRNTYESALGTFANATTPPLNTFSDFATYARENLNPTQHPKIAMFCTGGIRCEKASAYLLQQGFPEVYHLKGGILKYLEQVPKASSQWQGACYIFDERVTVDHQTFPTPKPTLMKGTTSVTTDAPGPL